MKKLFTLFLIIITITSNAQTCDPVSITSVEHEGSGNRVNWTTPKGRGEVIISQGGNFSVNNVLGDGHESFGVYHRFTSEDLATINCGKLTQVVFAPTYGSWQTVPGHNYVIQIYKGGIWGAASERNPGTLISSQELNNVNLLFNEENTINLETPVTIDASQELWIGYFCFDIVTIMEEGKSPAGYATDPCKDEFGNIMYYKNQWCTLLEIAPSSNVNWVIKGKVQTLEGATVNIYYNENKLVSNIPGTTYFHPNPTGENQCYKVEVNCLAGGVSPKSNEVCITEAECHPATNLKVKYAADCGSADLTWAAPQNMSGTILYNIYRNDTLLFSNHSATSYTTTNFNPNAVNIWSVKVVCPGEESDAVSVTKEDCTVGVKDNGQIAGFTLYPNPAGNELRVKSYELRDMSVEIFDVYGRKQKAESRKQKAEGEIVVNVTNLLAGIYFVKIYSDTGITIRKVVIEK